MKTFAGLCVALWAFVKDNPRLTSAVVAAAAGAVVYAKYVA